VGECLIGLEEDVFAGKRLHGDLKENFSLRVGKLRIIYAVSEKDKVVSVVAIGPRKSIYQ
jgi:mRNA-degrading endonuclease RelE of RelBE toxin-antitoxin system